MAKYKVVITINGNELEQDEIFDTTEEASTFAWERISEYHTGMDVIKMSNPGDFAQEQYDSEPDYYLVQLDD